MNYFSDPQHAGLLDHYINDQYLVFTREWAKQNLPPASTGDGLRIVLLDQTDGKKYESKIYVAYDEDHSTLDLEYQSVPVWSLMRYFYGSHHCPCHRKHDARRAGASVGENEECEGNRFLIERITPPNSDLILHSEVYTAEQLEEMLLPELKKTQEDQTCQEKLS